MLNVTELSNMDRSSSVNELISVNMMSNAMHSAKCVSLSKYSDSNESGVGLCLMVGSETIILLNSSGCP